MTARNTDIRPVTTPDVRIRSDGDVDEATLAYLRAKVEAALGRPGLPVAGGEVRVARAAAHHAEQPWSANAEIRVGSSLIVVHAREATAHELADRLQARLRGQVDRAAHRPDSARRSAAPPPWRRGGSGTAVVEETGEA